jgi:hypothetical protein
MYDQPAHKKYRDAHPEVWKRTGATFRNKDRAAWAQYRVNQRLKDPESYILSRAKRTAKMRGFQFNIDTTDIIIPQVCPLLGIPIVPYTNEKRDRKHVPPGTPSLDRIDSSKGYIKGNVWIISNRANTLKNESTITEIEMMYLGLKKKLEETENADF